MTRPRSMLPGRHVFPALTVAALCACGGGSTRSVVPPTGAAKIPPGQHAASLSLVIAVPPKSASSAANKRRPQFVSPAVRSISVTVASVGKPAGPAVTANVSCTSANCSATVVVLAPIGVQDIFSVVAYDAVNASGHILSSASVVYDVVAGGITTVPVVLDGVVAAIRSVSVTGPHPPTGSSATSTIAVTAVDASGAIVVGTYATAVNVQLFENDPDAVFSLGNATATNGIPLTLLHSSTELGTVSLRGKAGADVTTPDDATLVASPPGQAFVPNKSSLPAAAQIAELTTACPVSSAACVYYPSGDAIIAAAPNDITQWTYQPAGTAQWATPGSLADPDGGKSIWNIATGYVPAAGGAPAGLLLRFDTGTDTFGVVASPALGAGTLLTDIGGTLWAASTGLPNPASSPLNPLPPTYGVFRFATTGNAIGAFIPDPAALAPQSGLSSTLDTAGRLWATEAGLLSPLGVTAFGPAANSALSCTFSSSDQTFTLGSSGGPVSVAGSTVWAAFAAGASSNAGYVVKIPAAFGAGCAAGALSGVPAFLPASANPAVSPDIIESTLVDPAGNLYALEPTVATRISAASGALTNIVDQGAGSASTSLGQMYVAFALDAPNATLYLLDALGGTLDRTSSVNPATGNLPGFVLPPVLGAALSASATFSGISAQLFMQPNGTLWIANASFDGPTAAYSILGSVGTVTDGSTGVQLTAARGGLVRINLSNASFVQSAARNTRSIGQIRALAHARFLRSFRRAAKQRMAPLSHTRTHEP